MTKFYECVIIYAIQKQTLAQSQGERNANETVFSGSRGCHFDGFRAGRPGRGAADVQQQRQLQPAAVQRLQRHRAVPADVAVGSRHGKEKLPAPGVRSRRDRQSDRSHRRENQRPHLRHLAIVDSDRERSRSAHPTESRAAKAGGQLGVDRAKEAIFGTQSGTTKQVERLASRRPDRAEYAESILRRDRGEHVGAAAANGAARRAPDKYNRTDVGASVGKRSGPGHRPRSHSAPRH